MEAQRPNNAGFAVLFVTLAVTVFGMLLAFNLVFRGGIDASATEVWERSFYARNFADACAEDALFLITASESYEGDGDIDFDAGECEFSVEVDDSESTIRSSGVAGNAVRKVLVIAQTQTIVDGFGTTTAIESVQWSEVEEF